eukprot:1190029-Prorocentrum_minimum.AAC.3
MLISSGPTAVEARVSGVNTLCGHASPSTMYTHSTGVQRGSKGICWSSLDARKPQNPTKSEEYQKHLQGVFYIV